MNAQSSLQKLLKLFESSNWDSFIPDLLSGSIIVILFSWLFPKFLDWRNRPRLKFLFRVAGPPRHSSDISASEMEGLVIRNESANSFQTVYWSMYTPKELKPVVKNDSKETPSIKPTPCGNFYKISGQTTNPIFPYRTNDINFSLEWEIPKGVWTVYYFFSTEKGISPAKAKKINFVIEGPISSYFKYMDKLTIRDEVSSPEET